MERIKRTRKRPPHRTEQPEGDPALSRDPRTPGVASRKTADVLARIDRTLNASGGDSAKAGV